MQSDQEHPAPSNDALESSRHENGDSALKSALKKVRASPSFNRVATSTVRAAMNVTGLKSDFVVRHLHRVGEVRSRLPNGETLRLRSRADDWVSNQVFWRGLRAYEPESVPLFYSLAARSRTTLDVGAYVGFYSLLAAHANPAGRVYAFEPLPAIYDRLKQNVELNDLKNVTCVPAAVSDTEGTAEFFHGGDVELPTSSSLSRDFMESAHTEGLCGTLRSSSVPVLVLDRFVAENGLTGIDLIKIDTESTEPQVLRGMVDTIKRDQPLILCEVLPWGGSREALQDVLSPLGYRYYHLTAEGPVLREQIEGHPEWLNYLFTPLGADEVNRLWRAGEAIGFS